MPDMGATCDPRPKAGSRHPNGTDPPRTPQPGLEPGLEVPSSDRHEAAWSETPKLDGSAPAGPAGDIGGKSQQVQGTASNILDDVFNALRLQIEGRAWRNTTAPISVTAAMLRMCPR